MDEWARISVNCAETAEYYGSKVLENIKGTLTPKPRIHPSNPTQSGS